jgi:hypothetical protein
MLNKANKSQKPAYEAPKLIRHGKLAEVTQTSPPDALDSTMQPGERRMRLADMEDDDREEENKG